MLRKQGVDRVGPEMSGNSVLNKLCKAYATRLRPFNTRRPMLTKRYYDFNPGTYRQDGVSKN